MNQLYVQTPVLQSTNLSKEIGLPVFLKIESIQPSGSFWNRGVQLLLKDLVSSGNRHFVASANANQALALAYCSKIFGSSLKVVISKNVPSFVKDQILQEGAELIVHSHHEEKRIQLAKEIAKEESLTFIDLHTNPLVFDGISTIIYEIFGIGIKPEAILLPVQSGELLKGVLQGLKSCQWMDVPIITSELEHDCPFATMLFAEEDSDESLIPGLFNALGDHKIYPQIVSDKAALHAGERFLNEHRLLIERDSASALALVYENLPLLKTFSSVLVIVTGGIDVTLSTYSFHK